MGETWRGRSCGSGDPRHPVFTDKNGHGPFSTLLERGRSQNAMGTLAQVLPPGPDS